MGWVNFRKDFWDSYRGQEKNNPQEQSRKNNLVPKNNPGSLRENYLGSVSFLYTVR